MKNLSETLKDLYNEIPRDWSHTRCTDKTFNAMRAGSAIRLTNVLRFNIFDLQIVVDAAILRDDVLALYDRHHQFVRSVEFAEEDGQ